LFIDYFIRNNKEANITQNINELASNYLYVSTRTIEDILFYQWIETKKPYLKGVIS